MRGRLLLGVALLAALAGGGVVTAAPAVVELAPVTPAFSGDVPTATLPSYGARGMHVVGYEHGRTSRMTLTLRNTGPLPMTVTSLAMGDDVAPLLAVAAVRGLPLDLGPGERGELVVDAVLGNCRFTHERQVETHDGVRLGFRVLGSSGVRDVPFDRPLLVHSPMIVGCPDRKLNRQADNRKDLLRAG
jgi:hypothetical protein